MRTARLVAFVSLCAAMLLTLGSNEGLAASSSLAKTCDRLDGLQEDISQVGSDLDNSTNVGAATYTRIGKAFTKASKTAPKTVKKSLKRLSKFFKSVGKADNAADVRVQIQEKSAKYSNDAAKFATFYATECSGDTGGTTGGSGGGGSGGTLTLGGETIQLGNPQCYLQNQTAAGQEIEWTAQATGTNAAGKSVNLDFTRYAKGGSFEGDDVSVMIGQPGSTGGQAFNDRLDYGAVHRSGSTLSLSATEMSDDYSGTTTNVSFEIKC